MATAETPTPETKAAWQRFTLLDVLLLFPPYAIATAIMRPVFVAASEAEPLWLAVFAIAAATLGSVFAGPTILGAQYVFRRRRALLTAGELFWLTPLPPTALIIVAIAFHREIGRETHRQLLGLGALYVLVSLLPTLAVCVATACGRKNVPCFWTDRFGVVTSVTALVLAGLFFTSLMSLG